MAELDSRVKNVLSTALNERIHVREQYARTYEKRREEYLNAKSVFEMAEKRLLDVDTEIAEIKKVLEIE